LLAAAGHGVGLSLAVPDRLAHSRVHAHDIGLPSRIGENNLPFVADRRACDLAKGSSRGDTEW
jgi:hypothetical protein